MRTVVCAYHDIGCIGIEALLRDGFDVAAVFTHADDPHENVWFGSVAEYAASRNIPVYAPQNINHAMWVERIRRWKPDFLFSFYYRNLIKAAILDIPASGCLNLHGSLLPAYRGRCPINWVLVNGEKETGVTLHYMTTRPDAGDIVGQERIAISDNDTAHTLHLQAAQASERLLRRILPLLKDGSARRAPQDHSRASYFGGRSPKDGAIDWSNSATCIRNLVRAVTRPYPGAFSFAGDRKLIFWAVSECAWSGPAAPGTILSVDPFRVACGENAIQVDFGQSAEGIYTTGAQLAQDLNLVENLTLGPCVSERLEAVRRKKVLILGINGFIGNALSERLLESGRYAVHGMDLHSDYIQHLNGKPGFHFIEGDISIHREWIEYQVRTCDVVVPLVAIATPIEYTRNPLRVFELDFEENLKVVRYCVKYKKRIVFPSTSEVYGMCTDEEFDEDHSNLILGPIHMQRWIYACIKQLLDRVIWAYGQKEGLSYTLFRPFNWIGPKLDRLTSARIGSSRVITQLILNLVEGTPVQLVDGGEQKRCFTDVSDATEALFRIVENADGVCDGKIINIGNPDNEASIRELAELLVKKFEDHPLRSKFPTFAGYRNVESGAYYGKGYQDIQHRRPSIRNAKRLLHWTPTIELEHSVEQTLDFFLRQAVSSEAFDVE